MESVLKAAVIIGVAVVLWVSVDAHWGASASTAAVCAVWLLMPERTS
jgi:hypothetical protein